MVLSPAQASAGSMSNTTMPQSGNGSSAGSSHMAGGGMTQASQYKDGTYTGSVADAYYGYVQVQVTITGGKITDVTFLQHPNDNDTSRYINSQAMPYLQQEAVQAQKAQVNTITGATDTSLAFIQSLTAALSHAS